MIQLSADVPAGSVQTWSVRPNPDPVPGSQWTRVPSLEPVLEIHLQSDSGPPIEFKSAILDTGAIVSAIQVHYNPSRLEPKDLRDGRALWNRLGGEIGLGYDEFIGWCRVRDASDNPQACPVALLRCAVCSISNRSQYADLCIAFGLVLVRDPGMSCVLSVHNILLSLRSLIGPAQTPLSASGRGISTPFTSLAFAHDGQQGGFTMTLQ